MELLQTALPNRHASVRDLAANATGAAVAVGVWRLLLRRVRTYRIGAARDRSSGQ